MSQILIIRTMIKNRNKQPKKTPCDFEEIDSISYSAFSQEELLSYSVLEIDEDKFYENEKPVKGGVFDLRLGVSSPNQKCQTCGETVECPGHIGHIKLNEPIFHYGYMEQMVRVLRCICHHCFRLKRCRDPKDKQKVKEIRRVADPQKRLTLMSKLLQGIRKCNASIQNEQDQDQFDRNFKPCGFNNHKKVTVKNYKIVYYDENKKLISMDRKQIRRLLMGISFYDNQCEAIGFTKTRPIDLMIESLVVPPPQVRPYVLIRSQSKFEDDLSVAYAKVIRLNRELRIRAMTQNQKEDLIVQMERLIGSIMFKIKRAQQNKNKKKDITQKIKSISERWRGKQGRFRQNLLGKRVDFSARTVISPDSNLDLNEIGIPQTIAKNLTYPEKITILNYDRIVDLCLAKKVKILINPPESTLRNEQIAVNIQKIQAVTRQQMESYVSYGMIAERALEDGDYVLLNRQPTLHRMSMMAHKVKILPYNTFRINLSVCLPYNADFDGDQMNIHVPQSYESLSELKNISAVENQIVGPKNGTTTMGFSQDSLLGACLITSRETFLTLEEIMNLLMWTNGQETEAEDLFDRLPIPTIIKPQCFWTGKQIISLIIPKQIQIKYIKSKTKQQGFQNLHDKNLIIKKGQIITGHLQKQFIGASSSLNNIIHFIWMEKGAESAKNFISNLQKIVYYWLMNVGFSIGAADAVPDPELLRTKQKQNKEIDALYYTVFNQYRNKKEINDKNLHQQGKRIMESFEFNVNLQLNNRLSKVQEIVRSIQNPINNNICKIVQAKSKGSDTNLAQILYTVGNQNINGMRCPLGFSHRALPHFRKDDNSPIARGYVISSFFEGLKPDQFFFHSMGGREGLSDTAVKTSHVGYLQRKIVKSLEDIIVKYDSSVRDSNNNILQTFYGEDGFAAEFIEKHRCHGAQSTKHKFRQLYKWKEDELKRLYRYSAKDLITIKLQYSSLYRNRKLFKNIFCTNVDAPVYDYYCPITIERLINEIKLGEQQKSQTSQHAGKDQKIGPLEIYEAVQNLLQQCVLPPQKYLQQIRKQREQEEIKTNSKAKRSERLKNENDSFSDEFQREDIDPQKIIYKYYNHSSKVSGNQDFQIFKIHLRFSLSSKILIKIHNLTKQHFYKLINLIKQKFFKSLAPAGQAVGCLASQSIGEPTTQMTLNTFHLAGISDRNVTLGLPRIEQLLNCSKTANTNSLITIFPLRPVLYNERLNPQSQMYLLDLLMYDLPERKIKDFICSTHYSYNPTKLKQIQKHLHALDNVKRTPWMLQFVFNFHKIGSKKIWQSICQHIEKNLKGNLEVDDVLDFNDMCLEGINPKISLRYLQKITQQFNLPDQETKQLNIYKILSHFQSVIKETVICGIKGLESVKIAKKILHLSEQTKQKQYVVFEATGNNLKDCLSHKKINKIKTYSNNIQQIDKILGIEAARQCLINQLKEVLKPYGIVINYRHLSILADWMCMRGSLTPVNRYGLHKLKSVSTLTKASYQKATDVLFKAAVFSAKDPMKDASQKIIFGQQPSCGTNHCKLMIDPDKSKKFTSRLEEQFTKIVNFVQQNAYGKTPKLQESVTNDNSMFDAWRSQLNSSFHISPSLRSPAFNPMSPIIGFSPTYSPHITNFREASPRYMPSTDYKKYEPTRTTDYSSRSISPTYKTLNSPTYNLGYLNKMNSPVLQGNPLQSVGEVNKKEEEIDDYHNSKYDDEF